jgi:hypothetical protein
MPGQGHRKEHLMRRFSLTSRHYLGVVAATSAAIFGAWTLMGALAQQHPPKPAAKPAQTVPPPTQQPQTAPQAVAVPAQPAPDPLSGDWRIIWLNKGNAVSQVHFATIDRQPDMAAGNGVLVTPDGKQCHFDSGLAYKVYGQIPSGNQIMTLSYTDAWKIVAHCDEGDIEFDMNAISTNGQISAVGRAVIHKKGAPDDSSFVLMQR